jgi:hypothetical protein
MKTVSRITLCNGKQVLLLEVAGNSDEVEAAITEAGHRLAKSNDLAELIAVAKHLPTNKTIVALGEQDRSSPYTMVPCLGSINGDNTRHLHGNYRKSSWPPGTLFAAIV